MTRPLFFHIEDDDADAWLVEQAIRKAFGRSGAVIMRGHNVAEGERYLRRGRADLILLDLNLPDTRSLDEGVVRLRQCSDAPIVVVSHCAQHVLATPVVQEEIELHVDKAELQDPHHVAHCLTPLIRDIALHS